MSRKCFFNRTYLFNISLMCIWYYFPYKGFLFNYKSWNGIKIKVTYWKWYSEVFRPSGVLTFSGNSNRIISAQKLSKTFPILSLRWLYLSSVCLKQTNKPKTIVNCTFKSSNRVKLSKKQNVIDISIKIKTQRTKIQAGSCLFIFFWLSTWEWLCENHAQSKKYSSLLLIRFVVFFPSQKKIFNFFLFFTKKN